MRPMEWRFDSYPLLASWVALGVAALCALLTLITGLAQTQVVLATVPTLLLSGAGAMLVAVWALLLEVVTYGVKTK